MNDDARCILPLDDELIKMHNEILYVNNKCNIQP